MSEEFTRLPPARGRQVNGVAMQDVCGLHPGFGKRRVRMDGIDEKSLFERRGHTPSETDLEERFHGRKIAK